MKNISVNHLFFVIIILTLTSCELSFETLVLYDERDDFVGTYEVEEYSEGTSSVFVYNITIRKSRYSDGVVWIDNFYDANMRVSANVVGNRIHIPLQRVGGSEMEGRGSLFNGEELSMTYTVRELLPGPDYVDFLSSVAWKYY